MTREVNGSEEFGDERFPPTDKPADHFLIFGRIDAEIAGGFLDVPVEKNGASSRQRMGNGRVGLDPLQTVAG